MIKNISIAFIIICLLGGVFFGYQYYKKNYSKSELIRVDNSITKNELTQIDNLMVGWSLYKDSRDSYQIRYPAGQVNTDERYSNTIVDCILESSSYSLDALENCYNKRRDVILRYVYGQDPFQHEPLSSSDTNPTCVSSFYISVLDKPSFVSLENLHSNFKKSEYVTINGMRGLRRNDRVSLSPGGGGSADMVYFINGEKLFMLSFYLNDMDNYNLIGEKREVCLAQQKAVFDKMVSSFEIIK